MMLEELRLIDAHTETLDRELARLLREHQLCAHSTPVA